VSAKIPLGRSEDQRLEFKSRDALRHLQTIGRGVVAMLNSGGGALWIGIVEEGGRAVRIEDIEHPDREINRLRDHLADSIEPSVSHEDVDVQPVRSEDGQTVLRITIQPRNLTRPYSLRDGTGRHFLKRVADRVRPMSHEEIFDRAIHKGDRLEDTKRRMRQERDALQKRKLELLWVRIQPVGGLALSLDRRSFQPYFVDPLSSGNRATGWNFVDPSANTRRERDKLVHGEEGWRYTSVSEDGGIAFTLPLGDLYWKSAGGLVGHAQDTKQIWPFCLLEFPISVFRLASTIYKERGSKRADWVLGDLALFGLKGWTLRPHSPFDHVFRSSKPFAESDLAEPDLVWDKPLMFSWDEIIDHPDRCGFRLVQRVYEAFGFEEHEMPREFDRESGRLAFSAGC